MFISGGSCLKCHFCRDKLLFATKHVFCRDKRNFVATKIFSRDKTVVATNICRDKRNFVATSLLLSRQTRVSWRQKFCRGKHTFVAIKECLPRQYIALAVSSNVVVHRPCYVIKPPSPQTVATVQSRTYMSRPRIYYTALTDFQHICTS